MGPLVPGGTLTLDLASVVGWAYGHDEDRVPLFGTWKLPKIGGEGARYASFENELITTVETCQPRWIVLEKPLPPQAQTHARSAEQQYALRGMAYSTAYRNSIPISEIDAYTVRVEVLGAGRPVDVKLAVVSYCRKRGWIVPDHNAGDACLIWQWHRQRMRGPAQPTWREAEVVGVT